MRELRGAPDGGDGLGARASREEASLPIDRDAIARRLAEILTSPQFSALALDPARLCDDTSLLNDVVMDSIQLLEFIVEMENAFGFRASSRDLTIDVFERFGRVVEFVEKSVAMPASGVAGAPHA